MDFEHKDESAYTTKDWMDYIQHYSQEQLALDLYRRRKDFDIYYKFWFDWHREWSLAFIMDQASAVLLRANDRLYEQGFDENGNLVPGKFELFSDYLLVVRQLMELEQKFQKLKELENE